MVILAYGVEQPTTGDPGNVFFPALEHLCQRMATHNHDGNNSAPVSSTTVVGGNVLASAASFVNVSPGVWSQTITLPAGFSYDNSLIQCREDATKEITYCEVVKASPTTATVFAMNNDLDIRVYFK